MRIPMLFMAVLLSMTTVLAQTVITVSGKIANSSSKETINAVSVTIKGSSVGAYTDDKGNFKFSTSQKPPFTLVISSVGYSPKEVEYTGNGQALNIELDPSFALGVEVVVAASRLPERILESPVSIERVSAANIRNAPGASYYDALANLKGVDITTSGYMFKTPSTRGFNGSGSLRFNQLVDGMDNTLPALNFSVGNVIGLTELDVDNMELLPGASSALYGSGGMNGTLLISSKDPFKYQGLSFQVKQGVMHMGDSRQKASPFYDWSLRWGKKVSDKFAFKFGAQYIKADDWQADDKTNLLRNNVISSPKSGDRNSDPNYDGVNVFGDEISANMSSFAQAVQFQTQQGILQATGGQLDIIAALNASLPANATQEQIGAFIGSLPAELQPTVQNLVPFYFGSRNNIYGAQSVSRTGYDEKDIVDYNTFNFKFSGGLYYKISSNTEASLTGNWGSGTSVYTGADRYALKNFQIGQYKLEFKSKNWFLRGYTTQENSGDSYASTLTAIAVNSTWKSNGDWLGQYVGNYSGAVLAGTPSDAAHAYARSVADAGRLVPGTQAFKDAFNKSITTPISEGGSQFADKSDLWQYEGQWNLSQYVKFVDVLIGSSYRQYSLNSKGTIFADGDGRIKIGEVGGYIQLQKSLLKDVLKLTAAGRYDKNKNFDGRFTPRVTASIKVAKENNIRLSYQQAYRFPTNQDQWINLITPGSILIGCLPYFADLYQFSTNPVYSSESIVAYRASVGAGAPNPTLLKQSAFTAAKPESVQSFEIGYRGIIGKKLLVDAYYYNSKYKDFIARSAVGRGVSGVPANVYTELASPFTTTNYSFVVNSPTPVKANGFGIGLDYQIGRKGYKILANYYTDQLVDVPSGLVTFFNTPKNRYNLGFANANAYKGFGFNLIYKWQSEVEYQGTFAAATIPSFGTMDMQISYKPGKSKNLIKIGGTNIFNNYYQNAFGNPYIGGLYYISFGYNVF
ncbi:TonB-dependent receptor plug domain-containing protein [Panacibacter sp. KCS-6]|uniref:TonB-dependent receptor plug domain-containing protein n=2 Tax=Limnovirga soli TaxID=2656915 RepID=A0A8J8FBJ8_9BACT|nr:TonB-dependent receptor plug domain-containing protein [Limnovirga soli]